MDELARAVPVAGTAGIALAVWFLRQTVEEFRSMVRIVQSLQYQVHDHEKRITTIEILTEDLQKFLASQGFRKRDGS